MTPSLTILTWTLVLALVQILLPALSRMRELGPAWSAGPRDTESIPVGVVTGRLQRAQRNLFETLPLFIAAVLITHIADRETGLTLLGAQMYLVGRILFVPLYISGIPFVRSIVWFGSMIGLALIMFAIL